MGGCGYVFVCTCMSVCLSACARVCLYARVSLHA